jgi:hypothetical protein
MFGGLAFLVHGNMACGVRGEDLIVRLAADAVESVQGVQPVRAVRRAWSRRRRPAPVEAVADVAMALVGRQRWVAYELLYHHPGGLDPLGDEEVERLGEGMGDWGSVGAFGSSVSGPA